MTANPIKIFAEHPTAANLLMILLILIGLIIAPDMRQETLPDYTVGAVSIQVLYPGAAAEEVENAICLPIEDALDGINNMKELQCEALEGIARARASWDENGELKEFVSDIKDAIESITTFPENSEEPVVAEVELIDHVVSLSITGPMSTVDLKAYAEQVKTRMLLEPGISMVNIQGFSDHQIRIEVPANTLRQLGISMMDIAGVINRQNINLPAGSIQTREQDVLIRFDDERKDIQSFENLIITGSHAGAEIRLGEIATIVNRFENDEDKVIFNGRRAAILNVTKSREEDTVEVGNAVLSFLEKEKGLTPPGVELVLSRNVFSIVEDRLNLLYSNGIQGIILVVGVLWLFFSLRFAFWVAMGLPVSFLGSLFVLHHYDYSINMLTTLGLLISIGLIMDDAIVIAENIAVKLKEGESPIQASIHGTQEVALGVISSFFTTVGMFLPLSFLEGNIGKISEVIPLVLIITLAVSVVEAFLILPSHMAHSIRPAAESNTGWFRDRFERGFAWFRDVVFGSVLEWAVNWRYLVAGLMILAMLGSASLISGGVVKLVTFPAMEGDTIEARLLLPQGTPLSRTEMVIGTMVDYLREVESELAVSQPEVKPLLQNILTQISYNRDAHEVGPHVATISVDLLTEELRTADMEDVLQRWRKKCQDIPDVINIKFVKLEGNPAGSPLEFRLKGSDYGRLKAASMELQDKLLSYDGVLDLDDDLRPGKLEMRLKIREGALAVGFDATTIANQLRSAYFGVTADEIQVGSEPYEVDVRLSAEDRSSLSDLEHFTLTTPEGLNIPLSAVARIETGRGYARINRIDSQRTITIKGDIDKSRINLREFTAELLKNYLPRFREKYPDITLTIEGETMDGDKTLHSMYRGSAIGIFGIFILLSLQFRSYTQPLIVMLAIPFGLVGAVWGHFLLGMDITSSSILGGCAIAGVVVNDSILLVSFLRMRMREGMSAEQAAKTAGRDRFRAVLLTSLTTVAGMMPILLETSRQAKMLIPMVTSMVFGLSASTIVILVAIPVFFTILEDFGRTNATAERS